MEVMRPVHEMDFDFNSARSSPYPSPPDTPKRFGDYYCSAPSSPSRLAKFYREFDDFSIESSSGEAFDWQVSPGAMRSPKGYTKIEDDFAFDVGDEVNIDSAASAEDLFDGGMIKPMMKPHQSQRRVSVSSSFSSPRSFMATAFSPRRKEVENGSPFASGVHQKGKKVSPGRERGRERAPGLSSSSRRATRSLSPLRVSKYPWEEEEQELLQNEKQTTKSSPSSSSTALTTSSSKGSQRKWRLKDFLFRSASEGRASGKDPLKKYTALFRKVESPSSSSSSSSSSSVAGSVSSKRRSRAPVSAHELHYAANRAAKEDLKKKTFLPYKQGILGRLAFNPAVHALANGFAFHK